METYEQIPVSRAPVFVIDDSPDKLFLIAEAASGSQCCVTLLIESNGKAFIYIPHHPNLLIIRGRYQLGLIKALPLLCLPIDIQCRLYIITGGFRLPCWRELHEHNPLVQ